MPACSQIEYTRRSSGGQLLRCWSLSHLRWRRVPRFLWTRCCATSRLRFQPTSEHNFEKIITKHLLVTIRLTMQYNTKKSYIVWFCLLSGGQLEPDEDDEWERDDLNNDHQQPTSHDQDVQVRARDDFTEHSPSSWNPRGALCQGLHKVPPSRSSRL